MRTPWVFIEPPSTPYFASVTYRTSQIREPRDARISPSPDRRMGQEFYENIMDVKG